MLEVPQGPRRTSGFSLSARNKLARCFANLKVLSFEPLPSLLAETRGRDNPNTLTIPYATSFHFLPDASVASPDALLTDAHVADNKSQWRRHAEGDPVQLESQSPRKLVYMEDVGGFEAQLQQRSGRPPGVRSTQWRPERLLAHERPILVSYVSMGKPRRHWAGDLWNTKELVRPLRAYAHVCVLEEVQTGLMSARQGCLRLIVPLELGARSLGAASSAHTPDAWTRWTAHARVRCRWRQRARTLQRASPRA